MDRLSSRETTDSQALALKIIAGLLVFGAMHMLGPLLVPFFLALVLAIALTPLANWIERAGLGRTASSLACMLAVAASIALVFGLLVSQAGAILQDSDRYLERFSQLLADATRATDAERFLESMGLHQARDGADDPTAPWFDLARRNAQALGNWIVSGLGGLAGFLGGVILLLAYLFYMLLKRAEWVDRLRRAGVSLGLRPRERDFSQVGEEITTLLGYLLLVSLAYVVIITLALWAIGVPRPLLWGILTGLLEVVPYFGPILSGALPTVMAFGTGGALWKPAAVVALFVALNLFEGYVVAPMLYGKAVEIDPVVVLFGVLFFGWLWGPSGLALAMPMMILLRGLIRITPSTPALDAIAEADTEGQGAGTRAEPGALNVRG